MSHAIALRTQAGSFHAPELDGSRIAACAGTIAINAALVALLLVPLSHRLPQVPTLDEALQAIDVTTFKPVEPPAPQVEVVDRPPTPSAQPTRQPQVSAPALDPVVASQPGDEMAEPAAADTGPSLDPLPPPGATVLQTLSAPAPAYPGEALRQGLSGTVELEILVGIDGRPLDARVVRSSGHRVLDQAARRAVLRYWTFHPAMRGGQAVQALGRVPIEFKLER